MTDASRHQAAELARRMRVNAQVVNAQAAADELHRLQSNEPVTYTAQEAVLLLDAIQKLAAEIHLYGPDYR